ncbi:hypothetical protein BH11ARM1_BH11ARM1_01070 [soil metagenome]
MAEFKPVAKWWYSGFELADGRHAEFKNVRNGSMRLKRVSQGQIYLHLVAIASPVAKSYQVTLRLKIGNDPLNRPFSNPDKS